jgi:hypothetical protein
MSVHVKVILTSDTSTSGPRMMNCYFFHYCLFTVYFLQLSNSYTTMKYCHSRCSKCPPCSVTRNASCLIRDPRMRQQGVLGHMFVRIFLCCPWNTYLNYGLFFRNTLYSTIKYIISKIILVEAGRYKNPYFMQMRMLSFIPCTLFYTIL